MPDSSNEAVLYKALNEDMRAGLKKIYIQISAASSNTNALFQEAAAQLHEVVKATESAAMNIMDIVEKQLGEAENAARILHNRLNKNPGDPELLQLMEKNSNLAEDLTSVLTDLSFQDITGQRLKKVSEALRTIEKSVVDLYLSSGLAIEAAGRDPGKDAKSIRAEAEKAVEEFRGSETNLKGPDNQGCKQEAIDEMLAQLGL